MLKIENLSLKLGNFKLGPLNFQVDAGEWFVILGRTGAGKTKLLECIAGIILHEGKIFWNNKLISILPSQCRRVGFIYQDALLFPHFSVFENIAYSLRIAGFREDEIQRKVEDIALKFGIKDLLERESISTLSGGQRQKVALAQVLLRNPSILLLDEPLSSLDPSTWYSMIKFMLKVKREFKSAIIHVTHNMKEAIILADRIAFMENGKIIYIGQNFKELALVLKERYYPEIEEEVWVALKVREKLHGF